MTFEAEQLGESGTELASLLRNLRKRAGLSGDRLAARCNMSQSKVSRIENGRTRPSLVDVEQILRALDAPPELVAEVSALARMANTEWRNVRELRRKGLGTRQAELKSLEASSTQMRYFLLSMVTGLLATPEYVRASLAHSTADTSKAVAGKLGRQAVLYDASKRFTFVLNEQAVRWPVVAPLALAEQMDRLASLSYLPNVQIGVIPVRVPTPRTPLSTFTIYDGGKSRTPRRPRRSGVPEGVRRVRGIRPLRRSPSGTARRVVRRLPRMTSIDYAAEAPSRAHPGGSSFGRRTVGRSYG
ncbi:Scr1 family TA system antitoxin-like transcriptional regulator [Streptomyces sp. NPDC017979]|uniref:Scr1 family TA system antitoxin-like transcriptional regulator n=1 Tax=Streptomyces sp. NPDC017979 TaxID=3365024 RepID=UPI0037BB56A8